MVGSIPQRRSAIRPNSRSLGARMAQQNITRRLAAILAADMVGYSRLTEKDE